jgi:hypothetical protein
MDQCYGDNAVTVATTRMIERLKARDYDAAGLWSSVANKLMDIQKIKMNIIPFQFVDEVKAVGSSSIAGDPGLAASAKPSANEN